MVELKGREQQKAKGQLHSHTGVDGTHACRFESLHLEGS